MNTMLIAVFGLCGLATIVWRALRGRIEQFDGLPPEWMASLGRIANEQALGHHRDARRSILEALQSLQEGSAGSLVAHHVRIGLVALLAKDSIFPEVVRTIRQACAAEPAVNEMELCLQLRDFLVEDIRQCEAIAESLGQIRRSENGAESMLIPRFQHA